MRYNSLTTMALCLSVLACADDGTKLPSEQSGDRSFEANASYGDEAQLADRIAELMAKSLRSPDMRGLVRDAMRSSLVTEHKLVLQDFVRTAKGKRLLARLGEVSGLGTTQVASWINSLPRLDFYVPAREHRLTWRGGPNAAVATNLRSSPPRSAYSITGGVIEIRPEQSPSSPTTVLMLQREERKSKRISPQRALAGSAIQDPDDGEIGITQVTTDEFGRTSLVEVADLQHRNSPDTRVGDATCNPDVGGGCGGGGGGGSLPVKTYLTRITTFQVCDNGFCDEGNEFAFLSKAESGLTSEIWIQNVPATGSLAKKEVLLGKPPTIFNGIKIYTKETDWSSGDDIWAYATYEPERRNYFGPIPLSGSADENGDEWPHKESPASVFEDYRLWLKVAWF